KRPTKGGIIAIALRDNDQLIEAMIVSPNDDVMLATKNGMAIRFAQSDARSMGRDTTGVRGIKLGKDDEVIGMILADPSMCLLTACENGYEKRTPIGMGGTTADESAESDSDTVGSEQSLDDESASTEEDSAEDETAGDDAESDVGEDSGGSSSNQ